TVAGGAPGAAQYLLIEELINRDVPGAGTQDPYPETREEMKALMDEVFDSPLYQFGNLFADHPDDRTAIMVVTVRARSFEDASEVWDQVWSAVRENEDLRPAGMEVAFVGNTATNYLFIAKELPWIQFMGIAVNVIVVTLVAITMRSFRAIVTVGLASVLTSIWWLGVLPSVGIGLAITLTLPIIFISAIGSDYALHLATSVRGSKDLLETFRTTGKAILFSFVTTFGAFLIYTQVSNLAVRRTMIATTIATVIIFAATLLIVPMMYGTKKYLHESKGPEDEVEVQLVKPGPRRDVVAVRETE
ncbi:MAG TPA: hypothetical protein VI997_02195, partial [Candidatus Thermoplasmatota archaeon]|nr:hypothetical protein [Candidatus Thermoplasmatota archaeon]